MTLRALPRAALAAALLVGPGLAAPDASAAPSVAPGTDRDCGPVFALAERIGLWEEEGRGEALRRSGDIVPHWLAAFERVPGGSQVEADSVVVFVAAQPLFGPGAVYPEGSAYLTFIRDGCVVADGWVGPRALNYVEVEAEVTLEGGEATPVKIVRPEAED